MTIILRRRYSVFFKFHALLPCGVKYMKGQISTRESNILRNFFVVFLSPSRQSDRDVPEISPRSLPFTSFPIHYSLIILPSDAL